MLVLAASAEFSGFRLGIYQDFFPKHGEGLKETVWLGQQQPYFNTIISQVHKTFFFSWCPRHLRRMSGGGGH